MKIRELYTDESRWTKGELARDSNGFYIPLWKIPKGTFPEGVSFCLIGALAKCYQDFENRMDAKNKIREAIGDVDSNKSVRPSIINYNDAEERTFEEIKALVERLDI